MSEYILRNEARQELRDARGIDAIFDKWGHGYCAGIITEAIDIIDNISSADVAPVVHGHWIEEFGDVISCRCSRCDHSYNLYEDDINGYPYCAWCGAKMDESEV